MRRLLVATILVAAVAPLLGAQAGTYEPPPGDFFPIWSPDASAIVYWHGFTGDARELGPHVVNPDGSHDRRLAGLPAGQTFAFDTSWRQIAFAVDSPTDSTLEVMKPDGSGRRTLAHHVFTIRPAFSPDGRSLAYVEADGVHVIGVDGTGDEGVAGATPADVTGLAWSPDGTRLAYTGIAGGKNEVDVATLATATATAPVAYHDGASGPSWSPDGAKLAFFSHPAGGNAIEVADAGAVRSYAIPAPENDRPLWTSDGASVVFSTGTALRRLDLASGKSVAMGAPSSSVALFGDGQVAYSATGECTDRLGIYVAHIASPVAARRITNDCHVYGTPGPDRLTSSGTLYEIVDGRGGDDVLVGVPAPYVGDGLLGGAGNDVLRGDLAGEVMDGGTGDDTIHGGPGPDVITGGPGRDRLYGDGGRDTIYARDGRRDIVDCGTNTAHSGNKELDIAYVDRRDVVRRCERVFRRQR